MLNNSSLTWCVWNCLSAMNCNSATDPATYISQTTALTALAVPNVALGVLICKTNTCSA